MEFDNMEVDKNLDDVQMLESESAAGSQLDGDTCSQLLDSSNDTLIQPQSPTSSISSHVKSMVVSHPGDPPTSR